MDHREFHQLVVAAAGSASIVSADDKPKMKDPDKPLLLQESRIYRELNPSWTYESAKSVGF